MQLGEEASEWGITELIDAGGDPADIAPPAVPRTQVRPPSLRHHGALSLQRRLTRFCSPRRMS